MIVIEVNKYAKILKNLKEHVTKIINYEKKEMIPLIDEENKSYKKTKSMQYMLQKDFVLMMIIKSIIKLEIIVTTQDGSTYDNGSTYQNYFTIKEQAKEFEGQFKCLWENAENYITISAPKKNEIDNGKTIT